MGFVSSPFACAHLAKYSASQKNSQLAQIGTCLGKVIREAQNSNAQSMKSLFTDVLNKRLAAYTSRYNVQLFHCFFVWHYLIALSLH